MWSKDNTKDFPGTNPRASRFKRVGKKQTVKEILLGGKKGIQDFVVRVGDGGPLINKKNLKIPPSPGYWKGMRTVCPFYHTQTGRTQAPAVKEDIHRAVRGAGCPTGCRRPRNRTWVRTHIESDAEPPFSPARASFQHWKPTRRYRQAIDVGPGLYGVRLWRSPWQWTPEFASQAFTGACARALSSFSDTSSKTR